MNQKRLDKWMECYAKNLLAVVAEKPEMYAYRAPQVPGVVEKMRRAFEADNYNKDGEAIKRTAKEMGVSNTRKGINEWLNAPDDEVKNTMDIPMQLRKGRDGWEATSMVHIPGRPLMCDEDEKHVITHVRVHTGKASRGGLYCSASEVTKTSFGFKAMMDFHAPKPWEHLGKSPNKCTEKIVAELHRTCLAKLLELRPELVPAPVPTHDSSMAMQVEDRATVSPTVAPPNVGMTENTYDEQAARFRGPGSPSAHVHR